VVSGLMHELILFYMGRLEPTFRMFGFFIFHGVCLTVEIALKRCFTARWQLPRFVLNFKTRCVELCYSLPLE